MNAKLSKARARKARETRVAYRVRRKPRAIKPRVVRPLVRKTAAHVSPSVPWEERVAQTDQQLMEWDAWLNEHEPEFEEKYPGHYLAIWDRQIIAKTERRAEIYPLAHQAMPHVIPLITYVPRPGEMDMVPSVFPVEWSRR